MRSRKKPQTIEYAFRFAKGTDTERSRMLEMIRVNLGELLNLVVLTSDGQDIHVDGFRQRDDPTVIYSLDAPVPQGEGDRT